MLIGDRIAASEVKRSFLAPAKDRNDRERRLRGLKSSVRSRQPARVSGVENDEERERFYRWAKQRVPSQYQRIEAVQKRYKETAKKVELLAER